MIFFISTERQSEHTPREGVADEEQKKSVRGVVAPRLVRHSLSPRGWMVFKSQNDLSTAWNEAYLAEDEALKDSLSRSTLDLMGFRQSIELRHPGATFGEDFSSDDVKKSFQLRLVAEDFGYVLAEVRKLLASGVVTHCSLDLVMAGSEISAER